MPIFGKTSDGTGTNSSSVDRRCASLAVPDQSGRILSITFRVWLDATGSSNVRGFIYSDSAGSPGSLLALSDEVAVTNTAEQAITANFSGSQRIFITANTSYWIGFLMQDPGTPNLVRSQDATASKQASDTDTYSTGPTTPWGAATLVSGPLDVYVTYSNGYGDVAWLKA